MNRRVLLFSVIVLSAVASGHITSADTLAPAAAVVANPPTIVIGFVGGYVKHDNMVHGEVQLAAELRADYSSGVYAEAFENHNREGAYQRILQLLDTDHDGTLSAGEKQKARIILYGHSWGASETLNLARELEKKGIPVLLTIQIDSVSKLGHTDRFVPGNVDEAVNFYQPHGLIRSQREIRAADPGRTKIIGNFRFDYKGHGIKCDGYPWWDRYLANPHTEIECDPNVWRQVDSMIRAKLPSLPQVAKTR